MDTRPIGVFDSGFGGLTAVRELRRLMPEENIVFFADSGRAPYGRRPAEQLRRMTRQDLNLMAQYHPKAIIAACGTVSSVSADLLRENAIPTIGVLDAAVNTVRDETEGPIALIATDTTINSGRFAASLAAACPGREITALACQEFVDLIEAGHADARDPLLREAVRRCLAPLLGRELGVLILGCTHFGLIAEPIRELLGRDVTLVEASACAARQMQQQLERENRRGGQGNLLCLTSGDQEHFSRLAPLFLGRVKAQDVRILPPMEV